MGQHNDCYYCREMIQYVATGGLITATHINGKTLHTTDMGRVIPAECIQRLARNGRLVVVSTGLFDDDPQVYGAPGNSFQLQAHEIKS